MVENVEVREKRGILQRWPAWLTTILLILIMTAGAALRMLGMDWDEGQHLHPDERFLTLVVTSIQPEKISKYFDTAVSTLNPHNVGHGFYVYGTLPLLFTRVVSDALGMSGYGNIYLVGRYLSALMDLLTVVLVFLAASRLFRNEKIGLLAAAFAAFSVLPIQLSHYFTVDTFSNFFSFLAIYLAIVVMTAERQPLSGGVDAERSDFWGLLGGNWKSLLPFVGFGLALGMAVASKVNAGLIAILLPLAAWVWWRRVPAEEQEGYFWVLFRNLVIAAIISLVVFRIFQPYAFMGPGFFGLKLNPKWIANLKEISIISSGEAEVPYAWQWARRPLTFALKNMVTWGLGLPLGILAWGGFLWMGWRILRGEWQKYLLLWSWTGLYFAWQSLNWVRAMRYQLLVYPTLAIIAAWFVFDIYRRRPSKLKLAWLPKAASIGLGCLGLVLTILWAVAFFQIYTRPVTRIAASEWIYANIPGPINLQIESAGSLQNQPLGYHLRYLLTAENELELVVKARLDGYLTGFQFAHVVDSSSDPTMIQATKTLVVDAYNESDPALVVMGAMMSDFPPDASDGRGLSQTIHFDPPLLVRAGENVHFRIRLAESNVALSLSGTMALELSQNAGVQMQYLMDAVELIGNGQSYLEVFSPNTDGLLKGVALNRVVDWTGSPAAQTIRISILDSTEGGAQIASAQVTKPLNIVEDPRGEGVAVAFSPPVEIKQGLIYYIQIELVEGDGRIGIAGNRPALESPWDDPLPLGLDGYNPFDFYSGLFRTDLNFEMYWDDTPEKLTRFLTTLDQADYLFLTSGRQWGTLPRVPERFPLTEEYYRALVGCPPGREIVWCYQVAQPGMFESQLGFELVKVFQSDPNLGGLRFNSQFAEEAFTVYDAPKVMIYKKTDAYSQENVANILGAVDLTTVLRVTPGGASDSKGTLLLPVDRLEVQRTNGTWAELFDWDSLINRSPILTVVLWYMFISLLGWLIFPLTRLAMGGLVDRGFALSRMIGLVVFAWLAWISGSAGMVVSRGWLAAIVGLMIVLGVGLAWVTRKELLVEIKSNWRHYLRLELLGLVLFAIFLAVRIGNPDLWHPYKGGEKPMDFSYFNAVLKSSTFPPYDPWFAGGYINYYYYGFVLVGMPVKLLGIIPSVAYNLILPTLYSLLGMSAFTVGFNLVCGSLPAGLTFVSQARSLLATRIPWRKILPGKPQTAADEGNPNETGNPGWDERGLSQAWLGGLAATAGMILLGNLASVRMVWHGLMRLVAPGGVIDPSTFFQRIGWTISGIFKYLAGTPLPYPPGDWYWIPSRVYSGEPITEFPLFTFLYADLHAHLIAIVLTAAAIAWTLSILLKKWQWKAGWAGGLEMGSTLVVGGLLIGALRPTNTWDFPTYLILAGLVVFYTSYRYGRLAENFLPALSEGLRRLLLAGLWVILFAGLAVLFYQPFARWFGQAYAALDVYKGERSPFWSYITHWGLFLFVLLSWFVHESLDWMKTTPASRLSVLKPYKALIQFLVVLFLLAVVFLTLQKIFIGWLVLGMACWALVLMLRPRLPETKRLALFMVGTALTITLVVELVTLRGDLGRMNTVFKFYLQAWAMFAVSSGAALVWLIPEISKWRKPLWKTAWMVGLVLLVGAAAWFPLLGGSDKIKDRINSLAPHTLDGMTYMAYSTYNNQGVELDLSQDYRAIRWMQENVKGSPVIVEGNAPEYRWGSRFTIYTGLPGVVGWNWHQRQQRAVLAVDWVWPRVDEVNNFYNGVDPQAARSFLEKYDVKYIVVGQMEAVYYTREGLAKFDALNGVYWKEVYREQNTVIYEVIQQ